MTNAEFNEQLRSRTLDFSIRVFTLIDSIPISPATRVISFQLGKCASSVGANFRAFCRGRSYREMYAKICIVVEEVDEVEFWLLNLKALNLGNNEEIAWLLEETLELIKITAKIKSSLDRNK